MPIDLHYNKNKDILYGKMLGHVTVEEVEEILKKILQSDEFSPDTGTLWDLREQDFTKIDTDFEMRLINIRKKHSKRGNARLAFVVSDDLGFGMSRMYQNLSEKLPQHIMVFRDYSEAEEWLLSKR
jgi:hypothetical protein